MAGYPVDLDVRGIVAVVVGLGVVGRRKALGLVEAGAKVRGIDPQGFDQAAELGVDLKVEAYRSSFLTGAKLVIASASPEVNRAVVLDARSMGIWVSSASDPKRGDFTVPAVWRSGPVTVAVSTGGASPALAATLRDRAALAIGPEAALLALILIDLRAEVLARFTDPTARRQALQKAGDPAWLDHLALEGSDATRHALRRALGMG